jgi:hypothetical protein
MESKKLIIFFIWTFVLVSIITLSLEGFGISFAGYIFFFFIALFSTFVVETVIPDKMQSGDELLGELREIKARLDYLTKVSN